MGKEKRFSEPISIRITPEQNELIEQIMQEDDLSQQDAIRMLLKKGVQKWMKDQKILETIDSFEYETILTKYLKGEIDVDTEAK
jgi:hypothetical protein